MSALYIVATPIGNLKDITFRAFEVLKEVDLVICEDTRVTQKLLNHFEIKKPLISYFQHSKLSKIEYIIEQLKQDKNLALVTDAGTPGISDPGNKLINKILQVDPNIKIIPIPGPCAAIAALSVSGFPTDNFIFAGFPPQKKGRNKFFDKLVRNSETVVFFESPHRILKALKQLHERLVENHENTIRQIVVCRELTKKFETIYRGSVEYVFNQLNQEKPRGEYVIVLAGSGYKVANS